MLERIDREIGAGERVGILGRSGVGKSTLLQILAGLVLRAASTRTAGKATANTLAPVTCCLGTEHFDVSLRGKRGDRRQIPPALTGP